MENAVAAVIFGLVLAGGAPLISWMQEQGVPEIRARGWLPFFRVVRNVLVLAGLTMAALGLANLVLLASN